MAKRKRARFSVTKTLQRGNVVANVPSVSMGAANGAVLGSARKSGMQVHFEKAECPCKGENERCSRCDGTGFYVKEVVDQFLTTPSTPWVDHSARKGGSTTQEVSLSNDARGDDYSVRERGRYGSNPLHDDHD